MLFSICAGFFFHCRHRKYERILESLDSHDNALQACMKDAQLLIFSSNQLPVDSQREFTFIHGSIYLVNDVNAV